MNNIHINKNFESIYDFGPKSEQLTKKSFFNNLFETLIIKPLKIFIFPGASFYKDKFVNIDRVEKSQDQLNSIGGENITMKTPDGDFIDGMYMSCSKFKISLEEYFDLKKTINTDGTISQVLMMKEQ